MNPVTLTEQAIRFTPETMECGITLSRHEDHMTPGTVFLHSLMHRGLAFPDRCARRRSDGSDQNSLARPWRGAGRQVDSRGPQYTPRGRALSLRDGYHHLPSRCSLRHKVDREEFPPFATQQTRGVMSLGNGVILACYRSMYNKPPRRPRRNGRVVDGGGLENR